MMWYWGTGVHWWGWLFGALAMVAFWAALIWAGWYFVTRLGHRPPDQPPSTGDPKRILDQRLASGEIDPEEYRRLRDLIRDGDGRTQTGQRPAGTQSTA